MSVKFPDILEHNNPLLALVDTDFVRGGRRTSVADLTALYALSAEPDQLKEYATIVYVTAALADYILVDISNVNNASGWALYGTILGIPPSYTAEDAQDDVGGILVDTATIDLSYNDGTPSITADLIVGNEDPLQNSFLTWDGTAVQRMSKSTMMDWIPAWRLENWDLSRSLGLDFRDDNRQSITLAAGEDELHGFIYAKGRLWASDMDFPNSLYRFNNPDDLTDYDKLQIGASGGDWGNGYDILYVPEKDKLYTVTNDTGSTGFAEIYEVDPETLIKTLVLSYDTSFWFIQSLASDGTYLYALVGDGTIIKLNLTAYTYTTVVVPSTSNAHAIRYDGTYLYVTSVNIARIARIDPTTLTVLQNTLLQGGQGITDDFCFAGDYIWLGLEALTGSILKVKKSDFTFTTITTGLLTQCYGTYFDGWYVWAVYNTSPGTLIRVDPETHEIYKKVLETGENISNEIVSDGQRLFVTCFLSPAKVIRLSVPQMTLVSVPIGVGTLTNLTIGNLSPLFTSSVATPTTTPAITFAQVSQSQNLVFASPNGLAGVPTFRSLVAGDIPSLAYVSSVASGNGMNFSTITSTGTITLGTPSSVTLVSTNSLSSNSHTHAFVPGGTTGQYIRGDGTLGTLPVDTNFANTNLTFSANRHHSANNHYLWIDNLSFFEIDTVSGTASSFLYADSNSNQFLVQDTTLQLGSFIFTDETLTNVYTKSLTAGVGKKGHMSLIEKDLITLSACDGNENIVTTMPSIRLSDTEMTWTAYGNAATQDRIIGITNSTGVVSSITLGSGISLAAGILSATGSGGTVTSVSGTANRITSTGGATPVIDIAATYVGQTSLTTLGTVTTGVWTGTNIALANGGTGATLVDPNADRIMFWDDSAGAVTWLAPSTGISISGTSLIVAPPINTLVAATATNTIDNLAYLQEWDWNSLTTGTAFRLSTNSITTGTLFDIVTSGNPASHANQKIVKITNGGTRINGEDSYGLYVVTNKVGGPGVFSGENIAGYFSATPDGVSFGASDTALYTDSGDVKLVQLTGKVYIGKGGTTSGIIAVGEAGGGTVQIQPANATGSWTLALPNSGGTNNYVLKTNGSGVSSWVDVNTLVSGSGITIGTTIITSGTSTRVLFDDGGTVGEDAGLVYAKATDYLTITGGLTISGIASQATVINENGADADFRVEGDTNANLLFIDASADMIGFGHNAPSYLLHAKTSGTTALGIETSGVGEQSQIKFITNAGELDMRLGGSASGFSDHWFMYDTTYAYIPISISSGATGRIIALGAGQAVATSQANSTLNISSTEAVFNESGLSTINVRMESDTDSDAFLLNAVDSTITLGGYGAGAITGTSTYTLGITSAGKIVEVNTGWDIEASDSDTTTNATITTATTIATTSDTRGTLVVYMDARSSGNGLHGNKQVHWKNVAGTVTILEVLDIAADYLDGLTTATWTVDASTSNLRIRITGEAATTINWKSAYQLKYLA